MEEERSNPRLVDLSPAALEDLAALVIYTRHAWGDAQAERYEAALISFLEGVAEESPTDDPTNHLRVCVFQTRPRAHGYRIFYRYDSGRLYILRIVHTAMNFYLEDLTP